MNTIKRFEERSNEQPWEMLDDLASRQEETDRRLEGIQKILDQHLELIKGQTAALKMIVPCLHPKESK